MAVMNDIAEKRKDTEKKKDAEKNEITEGVIWKQLLLKPDIYTIMFSYPLTWTVTSGLFVGYYVWFSKISRRRARI